MFEGKHSQAVKIWITQEEAADLSRLAFADNRKVSEMCRVLLRQEMYGEIQRMNRLTACSAASDRRSDI